MSIEILNNDTIVAIATANGIGSISIIRISGDEAIKALSTVTDASNITPMYIFVIIFDYVGCPCITRK